MVSPSSYTRLIVINTALPAGESAGKGFAGWRAYNRTQLDIAALMKRSTSVLTDEEAAAYAAPFPDKSFKAGVRRFPELVMLRENEEDGLTPLPEEGVESSLKAREFWSNDWQGESFMAIDMQDPVLGAPVMQALHECIKNCPTPIEIADAGHFAQEWGKEIAEAACDAFKLRKIKYDKEIHLY
jgi:haloalkane dehalogenase